MIKVVLSVVLDIPVLGTPGCWCNIPEVELKAITFVVMQGLRFRHVSQVCVGEWISNLKILHLLTWLGAIWCSLQHRMELPCNKPVLLSAGVG